MFTKKHADENEDVYTAALAIARAELSPTTDWKTAAAYCRRDLTAQLCDQFPHIPWKRVRSQAIRAGRNAFLEQE